MTPTRVEIVICDYGPRSPLSDGAGVFGVQSRPVTDRPRETSVPVRIDQVRFCDPDARLLVEAVQQEYVVRYGNRDETPMEPGALDPPHGRFFVAYADGVPVATGAWRWRPGLAFEGLEPATEIKRMFVVAGHRGRGIARAVLAHLEHTAAEAGSAAMVLETGLAQPEAIALYEAAGYRPMAAFGHYACSPVSRYYGIGLAAADVLRPANRDQGAV